LLTFVTFPEFDLSDDSYVEMTSTGSLQTIADTELRARLVAYYRVARNRRADARWAADHYERVESALRAQNVAVADAISLFELQRRFRSEEFQAELRHARAPTLMMFFFLEQIAGARRELLDAVEVSVPE
jgi:hypothetical protein